MLFDSLKWLPFSTIIHNNLISRSVFPNACRQFRNTIYNLSPSCNSLGHPDFPFPRGIPSSGSLFFLRQTWNTLPTTTVGKLLSSFQCIDCDQRVHLSQNTLVQIVTMKTSIKYGRRSQFLLAYKNNSQNKLAKPPLHQVIKCQI